jgi:hypothetical protein
MLVMLAGNYRSHVSGDCGWSPPAKCHPLLALRPASGVQGFTSSRLILGLSTAGGPGSHSPDVPRIGFELFANVDMTVG